jgi:hypothetical protein
MVISKNLEGGLWCVSGKIPQVKRKGYMCVSASVRSLVRVFFPRASANGERGKSFKPAERTPRSISRKSSKRIRAQSRSASNPNSGWNNHRIASESRSVKAMRSQSKEHWTSGFSQLSVIFHLETLTIFPSSLSSTRCPPQDSAHELSTNISRTSSRSWNRCEGKRRACPQKILGC